VAKTKKPAPVTIESIRATLPHRLLFVGDKLVAADAGILSDEQRSAMKTTRFTAYLKDAEDSGEEIDVDAKDKASAKTLVLQILAVDYVSGLTIGKIVAQYGMYF
jgi:hypothetical protein